MNNINLIRAFWLVSVSFFFCSFFNLALATALPSVKESAGLGVEKQEDKTNHWIPAEDRLDWLLTTSKEWINGEIIGMYNDVIEFDSDEFGLVKVDWEDVAILRSGGAQSLLFTDRSVESGKVMIDKTGVYFPEQDVRRARAAIISIAPDKEGELDLWDGEIEMSADRRSGNSNQESLDLAFSANRRTSTSVFKNQYRASYASTEGLITDKNQRFISSWDWFFSQDIFFRPVSYEFNREPFKNIAMRHTYSALIGYHLVDKSNFAWDIALGPGYQLTQFEEVEADTSGTTSSGVLEINTDLEWDINKDLEYDLIYSLKLVSEDAGKMNHHFETGLNIELTGKLDLLLRYILDRIEEPQAGEFGGIPDKNDDRLLVGISYEF